jgi:hypothetical protein
MTIDAQAPPGARILQASKVGTAVFIVTSVAGVLWPGVLSWPAFAVALALFLAGCALFVWAFVIAVGRSRTDEIAVTSLYLLAGSAPAPVRQQLLGSLGVEVAVALGTAIARPYTVAATGILVPVYALGLCGLWAARYGTFPPRQPAQPRQPRAPRR